MHNQTEVGSRSELVRGLSLDDCDRVSLCELLDRVLNKGAVVVAELTISVADIDLVYLGLQLVLTSIETGRKQRLLACSARDLAVA
jgi:hypothetical protein